MTYELDESNGEKERECVRNWEGGGGFIGVEGRRWGVVAM
jgi:hypothetical protein